MRKNIIFILLLILTNLFLSAQISYLDKIELLTDTASYNSRYNHVLTNGLKKTYFYYSSDKTEIEVRFFPKNRNNRFELIPSHDYDIVDSLLDMNTYWRVKLKFKNLTQTELLRLSVEIEHDSVLSYEDIYLQPLSKTTASIYPSDNQLFIGEEKVYEVNSNNSQNLNVSREWISTENFDYRYSVVNEKVFLHVVPQKLGSQMLTAELSSYKPSLDNRGKLNYQNIFTIFMIVFLHCIWHIICFWFL